MREIKFRTWYKHDDFQSKEMEYSTLSEIRDTGYGDDTDDFHWMQFTGLKDKNGKEIYEGDIITYKKFANDACGDEYDMTHEVKGPLQWNNLLSSDDWIIENLRVIGNIYENPELLEGN